MQEVADIVFDKINNGGTIQEGEIISRFDDEEQSDVGRIFCNDMYDNSDAGTKARFASESLKNMVIRRHDEKCENAPPEELAQLLKKKNELSNLIININPD